MTKQGNAVGGVIKTPGALSSSSQTTYEDDHFSYDWGTGRGISRRNTKENISGDTLAEGNQRMHQMNEKQLKTSGADNRRREGENSPLNTSGSSITEEIFNTALSNLEFLSDEEATEITTQPPNFSIMTSDISASTSTGSKIETGMQRKSSMYCPETSISGSNFDISTSALKI